MHSGNNDSAIYRRSMQARQIDEGIWHFNYHNCGIYGKNGLNTKPKYKK